MWLERFGVTRRAAIAAASFVLLTAPGADAAPVPLSSVSVSPAPSSPAEGTWRTSNGTEVTIAPCDQGLCGTLSWIVIPKANAEQCRTTDKQSFASLILDYNNPDKSLQTRSLLGMTMLTLKPTGDPNSFNVRVYNPEDGSTNDAQLFILNNGNTLRIGGGCLGNICVKSEDWPRVAPRPTAPDFTCEGGQ